MRLPGPKRRGASENVVPLINVVFLLLMFFMLIGTVTRPDLFDVRPPAAESTGPTGDHEALVLLAADGRLALDDRELGRDALQQAIARRLSEHPGLTVRMKADAAVEAQRLIPVLEALREAGAKKLFLITALDRS